MSFLPFKTVVQPGKESNHYLGSHPCISLLKYWVLQGYDEFTKGANHTVICFFLSACLSTDLITAIFFYKQTVIICQHSRSALLKTELL